MACASYSTKIWDPFKRRYVKNTRGPGGKPQRYVTVIVFLDPRLHVMVSCSCADFRYRWEVALNRKVAAEIEYSNGELPVIRNPSMRTSSCKHLFKLYETIKPHLPARRADDKTPPIAPPKVGTAPSELRRAEAEREARMRQAMKVQPVRIQAPVNIQRSAKPGRKQSMLPRSVQSSVAAMKQRRNR